MDDAEVPLFPLNFSLRFFLSFLILLFLICRCNCCSIQIGDDAVQIFPLLCTRYMPKNSSPTDNYMRQASSFLLFCGFLFALPSSAQLGAYNLFLFLLN